MHNCNGHLAGRVMGKSKKRKHIIENGGSLAAICPTQEITEETGACEGTKRKKKKNKQSKTDDIVEEFVKDVEKDKRLKHQATSRNELESKKNKKRKNKVATVESTDLKCTKKNKSKQLTKQRVEDAVLDAAVREKRHKKCKHSPIAGDELDGNLVAVDGGKAKKKKLKRKCDGRDNVEVVVDCSKQEVEVIDNCAGGKLLTGGKRKKKHKPKNQDAVDRHDASVNVVQTGGDSGDLTCKKKKKKRRKTDTKARLCIVDELPHSPGHAGLGGDDGGTDGLRTNGGAAPERDRAEKGHEVKRSKRETSEEVVKKGHEVKRSKRETSEEVTKKGHKVKRSKCKTSEEVAKKGHEVKCSKRETSAEVTEKGHEVKCSKRETSAEVTEKGHEVKRSPCGTSEEVDSPSAAADGQHGRTDVALGQWATAQFTSDERRAKFLRLLGGQGSGGATRNLGERRGVNGAVGGVNGAVGGVSGAVGGVSGAVGGVNGAAGGVSGAVGGVSGAAGGVNAALTMVGETRLNTALERQFEAALGSGLRCRGGGLGYAPPPGKHHIDINRSTSHKFND